MAHAGAILPTSKTSKTPLRGDHSFRVTKWVGALLPLLVPKFHGTCRSTLGPPQKVLTNGRQWAEPLLNHRLLHHMYEFSMGYP